MSQLNGLCCFGRNRNSVARSNFIPDKNGTEKECILKLTDTEDIVDCDVSLNGKALVLARKRSSRGSDEYLKDHEQVNYKPVTYFSFYMFYEGYLSLMYTKTFSLSHHYSEHIISSDYSFALFIDQSVFEDAVSFSICMLDHKKYSKITPGKLYKRIESIPSLGKLLYHPVYCLSPDNNMFCFVMNGIWKNQNLRFCEIYLYCCLRDESGYALKLLLQRNVYTETGTFHEVRSCQFNTKGDKVMLIYGQKYLILCIKRNIIIASGNDTFSLSDLHWTVDIEHGECLIDIIRASLTVKVYVIDYCKKTLKEQSSISLTDYILNYSFIEPCTVAVSCGISRIFAGTNEVFCINPFTGALEQVLYLEGVENMKSYKVKDILPNWPGREVLVTYSHNNATTLAKLYNISYQNVFSLKSLAAIQTMFSYSLVSLYAMNLPKTLRHFLNVKEH